MPRLFTHVLAGAFACFLALGCAPGMTASTGGTGGADATGGSSSGGMIGSGGATGGGGAPGTGGVSAVDAGRGDAATGGSGGTPGRDASVDQTGTAGRGGAAGQAGTAGNTGAGGLAHVGVWRIMPLGDSITGTMCPPQLLSKQLRDNGHTNFIFVGGNLNNQVCNGAPNVQTEGHGGYLVTDLVGSGLHAAELPQWCAADRADVVLMMFGTNDAWSNKSTQSILDAYSVVLTDLRAVNPRVIMFVAQITPLNPAGCSTCETNVQNLNAQIPAWASSMSSADSPVFVVDVHSAFTAAAYTPGSTFTPDGVHPNPAGSALIADKWYTALLSRGLTLIP
jgi:acyl-CoA thioesterase I